MAMSEPTGLPSDELDGDLGRGLDHGEQWPGEHSDEQGERQQRADRPDLGGAQVGEADRAAAGLAGEDPLQRSEEQCRGEEDPDQRDGRDGGGGRAGGMCRARRTSGLCVGYCCCVIIPL